MFSFEKHGGFEEKMSGVIRLKDGLGGETGSGE